MLSIFPPAVIERAVDPADGIAARVTFLNLAAIRKCLDGWRDEYFVELDRHERANRKRLPEPPHDPEMEARVAQGMRELAEQLKAGIGPSSA
jgi:hypothetical protein